VKTNWVPYLFIAAALYWVNNKERIIAHPPQWGDYLMYALLGLLLWWLLSARGRDDTAHHEGTDQGIAFRLGKALNGIRRRKRV
jgi:hypothetical protein